MPTPFPLPSPPLKAGFSIDRFRSSFDQEPARNSQFDVFIQPPLGITFDLIEQGIITPAEILHFRCEGAEIPGKVSMTVDFRDYGPVSQIVNGAVYPDISLTFICTPGMKERIIFDIWQDFITNSDVSPLSGLPAVANVFNALSQKGIDESNDVNYYRDYVSKAFFIQLYDSDGYVRNQYHLNEAYPKMVQAQPLSWGDEDIMRLRVEFAFKSMDSIPFIPLSQITNSIGTQLKSTAGIIS